MISSKGIGHFRRSITLINDSLRCRSIIDQFWLTLTNFDPPLINLKCWQCKDVGSYSTCSFYDFSMGTLMWKRSQVLSHFIFITHGCNSRTGRGINAITAKNTLYAFLNQWLAPCNDKFSVGNRHSFGTIVSTSFPS